MGKTVLLGEFQRVAESRNWLTGMVEAGAGQPLRAALVLRLDLTDQPESGASTGNLELDLTQFGRDLAAAAAESGTVWRCS